MEKEIGRASIINREEMKMDSQSNIIQLVEALGLDYEKIRDAAAGMDPEEFEQRLMQELTGAVQKMGLDEYVEHKLETKEQKMQALKDVFGIGEITEADLEGVERTIEFGWASDCVLEEELRAKKNKALAEALDSAEKEFLAACKGWIERGEAVYLENFPFSVEMLLGLIEKDLMDVKYISSKKEMILCLQVVRN